VHLIHIIVRDVGRWAYIFHILGRVKEMSVPRFHGRQTECLGQRSERHGQVIQTVQLRDILHFQTHDLLPVHDEKLWQQFRTQQTIQ